MIPLLLAGASAIGRAAAPAIGRAVTSTAATAGRTASTAGGSSLGQTATRSLAVHGAMSMAGGGGGAAPSQPAPDLAAQNQSALNHVMQPYQFGGV